MAQLMSVTGHKSISACAVYQRVSNLEKQVMGDVISNTIKGQSPALSAPQRQLALPAPPQQLAILPSHQNTSSIQQVIPSHISRPYTSELEIPPNHLNDINLEDLFSDFDSMSSAVITQQSSRSVNAPVFHGCTITNLNITINRN